MTVNIATVAASDISQKNLYVDAWSTLPDNKVAYINLDNKEAVLDLAGTRKAIAELTKIADAYEKANPPKKHSDTLEPLGVGAVIQVNDESTRWVKTLNGKWVWGPKAEGQSGAFFDSFDRITVLSEGVK